MNRIQFFKTVLFLFVNVLCFTQINAQQWTGPNNTTGDIYRSGKVGVGIAAAPVSLLSVGDPGSALYQARINKTTFANGAAGLYVTATRSTNAGDKVYSILGSIPSGSGWTYGVFGASTQATAANAGRAHGVYGQAANASSGYNYGVFGALTGTANGAAVVGVDYATTPVTTWGGNTNGKWAGYFVGNVHVSNRLGINTHAPSERLQIVGGNALLDYAPGNTTTTGNLFFGANTTLGNNGMRLSFINGVPNTSGYIDVRSSGTVDNGIIFRADNANGNTEQMRIRRDGKVTIGPVVQTSTGIDGVPGTYRLYVRGGILTEKVKVAVYNTANWADYVFENSYRLRPLHEVDAFVKENKHLPGVPSAAEMVENGLDVATMDAKLLEKIEELTLYMIQLDRDNKALKAELEALKAEK